MSVHSRHGTVLGLTFFLLSFFLAASTSASEYISVGKDGVNLRSGPGTNHEILWEVFKGFPLRVLNRQGQWIQTVDFEGDKGWIFSPLASTQKTAIVKVKTGNMRTGPSTNYEIAARVKYGVVFQPTAREGEWVRVRHEDGTTGWVHKDLLWP
jgi:SH3-like domain-containing protein